MSNPTLDPTTSTTPSTSPTSTPRPLYGGALTISLPPRFSDVSHFRPVPDHQEVFADPPTDQSLVVELNQPLPCADVEAGGEHVRELAEVSGAVGCTVLSSTALAAAEFPALSPPPAFASLTVADMLVAKYRDDPATKANAVRVYMLLVRLPQHATDLLVILNSPRGWSEGSSVGGAGVEGRRVVGDVESEGVVREVCRTLRVNDYGLFGSGGGAAGIEGEGVLAGADERMQV